MAVKSPVIEVRDGSLAFWISEHEVAMLEFWPGGMPRELTIIPLPEFLSILRKEIRRRAKELEEETK